MLRIGGNWFLKLLGKGERGKGKGKRSQVRETGRVGDGDLETGKRLVLCNFAFLIVCPLQLCICLLVKWNRECEGVKRWKWIFLLTRGIITFFMFFTSQPVFMRVWPSQLDFAGFRVLTPILHVFCVLTRKIGRFYELKRIFNNHGGDALHCSRE